jgi:hypothetical protein
LLACKLSVTLFTRPMLPVPSSSVSFSSPVPPKLAGLLTEALDAGLDERLKALDAGLEGASVALQLSMLNFGDSRSTSRQWTHLNSCPSFWTL